MLLVVVVPAFQYIALVFNEAEPIHCRWGTEKGRRLVVIKVSKIVLGLETLTRVTSELNLNITRAVSKTVVRGLVGSLAMCTINHTVNTGRYQNPGMGAGRHPSFFTTTTPPKNAYFRWVVKPKNSIKTDTMK